MRVVSLNLGTPKIVSWKGRDWETAIYKNPVSGRIPLGETGFEGDGQADRTVHGGRDKAVYSYAVEHYAFWNEAGRGGRPHGAFGENLTTEGLDEHSVRVGDRFRVGGAVLEAVSPRRPCAKLGLRFDDASMVKAFQAARRPGIYFRVVEPGAAAAGDPIERIFSAPADAPLIVSLF